MKFRDQRYSRPTEVGFADGDATKASPNCWAGGSAHTDELARIMVDADMAALECEGKPWIDKPDDRRRPDYERAHLGRLALTARARVCIAGHGLVVRAATHVCGRGVHSTCWCGHAELDLTDRRDARLHPEPRSVVTDAVARVGGILAATTPTRADLAGKPPHPGRPVDAAVAAREAAAAVPCLSHLPETLGLQPIPESALLTGPLG